MENKNINKIRKKLDNLDDTMLSIIKKRSILVDRILSEKKFKNQIIDNKRINRILNVFFYLMVFMQPINKNYIKFIIVIIKKFITCHFMSTTLNWVNTHPFININI